MLYSCSSDPIIEKKYYEGTDILKVERIYHSDNKSDYEYISYYKNGQICMKGSIKNKKAEGIWEYWFADGIKKCTIFYTEGKEDYDYRKREFPKLIFESDSLKVGVQMRVKAIGLYFRDYLITPDNINISFDPEDEYYSYTLLPLSGDSVTFYYKRLELVELNDTCRKHFSISVDVSEEEMQNSILYKESLEKILTVPIYK